MASRSEEDLTCPTCMGIFNNPVLLTCGHSFCNSCLQRWWKEKRSQDCPVCRTQCLSDNPPRNLALKNLCEAFLLKQENKSNPEELKEKLKTVKQKLDFLLNVKQEYDKISEHVKVQMKNAERQIKKQFKTLHAFLEEEEEARIAALREEEEQRSIKVKEKMEKVSREMAGLTEIIRGTEEALKEEDTFLRQYKTAIDRVTQQRSLPDDSRVGLLIDVAKHVGNLSYEIWCKMKEVVEYRPVVLDPNTAGNMLCLSEDLTAFGEGGEAHQLPENRERLSFLSVLASEGYESGKRSWEVDVGESKCWGIGVIAKGKPGEELQECESWRLVNGFFGVMAIAPEYVGVPIAGAEQVRRIRVELDCGNGLTFTDPESNSCIHSFRVRNSFRGEKVFPYFYNWDQHELKILPEPIHIQV